MLKAGRAGEVGSTLCFGVGSGVGNSVDMCAEREGGACVCAEAQRECGGGCKGEGSV